jgi:putative nucleotidyltransferase with HDIG domain
MSMSDGEFQSGRESADDIQTDGEANDPRVKVWPILVGGEEESDASGERACRISMNTRAFLTMGGTGLAAAFVLSPALLLLDGMSIHAYVFLSCLMAVASFAAALVNYHIVLAGAHGIVKKVGQAAGLMTLVQAEGRGRPPNHGEIDKIETIFDELLRRLHADMEDRLRVEQDSLLSALTSLVVALEARDPYTRSHSRNVARYSAKLAQRLGLGEAEVDEIHLAGQLHDIGKIGVKDEVLLKPGALTRDEFGEIMKHPELSVNILKPFRHLDNIRAAIRHHHERMNGSGYPDGLKGEQIPLSARIMAVADAFDAMTSDRPYRPALSVEDTVAELKRMSGPLLDPTCVRAFLEMMEEEREPAGLALSVSA